MVLLFLSAALLAGCAGPKFSVDAPRWFAGYGWEYDLVAQTEADVRGEAILGVEAGVGYSHDRGTRRLDVFNSTGRSVEGHPFYAAAETVRATPGGDNQRLSTFQDSARVAVFDDEINQFFPAYEDWASGSVQFYPGEASSGEEDASRAASADFTETRLLDFPLTRASSGPRSVNWRTSSSRASSAPGP